VPTELDLVDSEDQITHEMSLDDELSADTGLDVFKVDEQYAEHEAAYEALKKEILGDDDDEDKRCARVCFHWSCALGTNN
jgi:pre-mRNA-splicing factor CWC22